MASLSSVFPVPVETHQRQRIVRRLPGVRCRRHIERLKDFSTGDGVERLSLNGFHGPLEERVAFTRIRETRIDRILECDTARRPFIRRWAGGPVGQARLVREHDARRQAPGHLLVVETVDIGIVGDGTVQVDLAPVHHPHHDIGEHRLAQRCSLKNAVLADLLRDIEDRIRCAHKSVQLALRREIAVLENGDSIRIDQDL